MKRIKLLLYMTVCMLLLVGCGNTYSKKELRKLKENAATYAEELDKRITFEDRYKDAVLVETIFEYTDIHDNSKGPDYARIFSMYQLGDGSIIYFNTPMTDMKGIGELPDDPYFWSPSEEREEYYLNYKTLAETGEDETGDYKLKSVGEDVYAKENDGSTVYYFIVE